MSDVNINNVCYVVDTSEPRQGRASLGVALTTPIQKGEEIDMASNIRAEIVLARYKATQIVKERYRAAGIKLTGIKASQLREEADALIHLPEVQAWARSAVTKIITSVPRKKA